MKNKIRIIFIFISSVALSQSSFNGINNWFQVNSVSFAGGGYLSSFRNDLRNPAMIADSNRVFNVDYIKYPAGINSQSLIANTIINKHYVGFKISRTSYGVFSERDYNNQKTGDYTAGDLHFQVGYAKPAMNNKLFIGVNTGLFLSQIQSFNARAITISPGIVFKSQTAKIGLTFQNYGKVFSSYTSTKENLPISRVFSLAGYIPSTRIEMEYDYISVGVENISKISGIIKFENNIILKAGTSSNRYNQKIDSSIFSNIFSDLGIGLAYEMDEIIIDIGSYSYGPGGYIFGIGVSSKF